jgi:lysophospholipase L1-like esterase
MTSLKTPSSLLSPWLAAALFAYLPGLIAAPLRIMPLGDSITAGYTDNPTWNVQFQFGYRAPLYSLLTAAGKDFLFVGGSLEPFNNAFGDPTQGLPYSPPLDLRPLGQNGHRGYGGRNTTYLNDNIAGWITTDTPDVILLMIGINGIDTSSPALLDTLVNTIFSARPAVQLIVAQITPQSTYNADLFNYNTYIRTTLIAKYLGLGYRISTVDQYRNLLANPAVPTSIDITKFSNAINHPTNAVYQAMAQTWFSGIQALPALPVPPPTPTGMSVSSSNELAYAGDVSATDLLTGLTGSNAVHSGWILQGSALPTKLNDGIHGTTYGGSTVEGAWAENSGSVSTFTLPASSSRGWDLSSVTSIAAWNGGGYGNQSYNVSVKRSGDPDFVPLADVNYQPFATNAAGASKVTLSYPNGGVVRGVKAIRFTMKATNGVSGRTVYREIDVFGTPTLPLAPKFLSITPAPANAGVTTLTWTSLPAASYKVEESIDLQSWQLLNANFPSNGTTTVYNRSAETLIKPKAFFRVSENP